MIDKIYIDFTPGLHGNFLRFLIRKFIYNDPWTKNITPFNRLGNSHNHYAHTPTDDVSLDNPDLSIPIHTYHLEKFLSLRLAPDPVLDQNCMVIPINWNYETDIYLVMYNYFMRAGDIVDLGITLRTRNDPTRLSYVDRRWILYQQITTSTSWFKKHYGFRISNNPLANYCEFDVNWFYDLAKLAFGLSQIARRLNVDCEIDMSELTNTWQQFMSYPTGYTSQLKIKNLLNELLLGHGPDFSNLLILEECYLNKLIIQQFNITASRATLLFNSTMYPTSSAVELFIKEHLKNNYQDFDITKSIASQMKLISQHT